MGGPAASKHYRHYIGRAWLLYRSSVMGPAHVGYHPRHVTRSGELRFASSPWWHPGATRPVDPLRAVDPLRPVDSLRWLAPRSRGREAPQNTGQLRHNQFGQLLHNQIRTIQGA